MRGWRILWLALFLWFGLPTLTPPATAHPFHLMIDNSFIGSPEAVYDARTVAQSFVPATDFVLTRISLRVEDLDPSDPLVVSVRNCCTVIGTDQFPGTTTLGSGSRDGPGAPPDWLDVDILPTISVVAGQTYWIVAESSETNSNDGYEWWNSGDDTPYGPGTAAIFSGGSWSLAGKDYTFRVYGYGHAVLGFSASVSTPTVGPGQTVIFRVNFSNTGTESSAALWVNVTLPAGLAYVSDDTPSGGPYNFTFINVLPGSYSFNVTARAAGGIADGTVLPTTFGFEGTDHLGAPLTSSSTDVEVTMRNARLSLSLTAGPDADPGDRLVLTATVRNLGSESAVALFIEGTVDANASYVLSTPAGNYTAVTKTVDWAYPSLGAGMTMTLTWTEDVVVGIPDQSTVTARARIQFEDLTGAAFPAEERATTTRVHSPVFVPVLRVDRTAAEAGQEVFGVLHYNNTGSVVAPRAWLNWSLGGHFALLSLSPALPHTLTTDGFSIETTNVPIGVHTVTARLRVVRGLQDRLVMGLSVSFTATDGNGNGLPPSLLSATVDLLAPALSVSQGSAPPEVAVDALFVLHVTIENAGRAYATAWLNVTLPSAVEYVTDNGTFDESRTGSTLSWRIPALPAGSRIAMAITLRGTASGTTSFRFALAFTDSAATPPASVLSNAVAVEFFSGTPLGVSWTWWLLGVLALIIPLAVFLVKYRVIIEEAFLVSHSGILLAHMSYTMKHERDRDVLAGMLTAIQDFIRDSFAASKEGALHSINFGERKILVRRGTSSYLAVIIRGRAPSRLQRRMDETLRKLESAFPQAEQHVDEELLDGASDVLSRELLGR